ncbi:MAG: 3-isopropylmalate dehydratase small subunit [Firmicutes bacterium]|nr:3-isopropylmalate dehydratase small subunit [Bacillota bacterium]
MNVFQGKTWVFGDDIDTDAIIPARYLTTQDPKILAAHCMEDAEPDFPKKVQPGDIIVGGKNFGCGSSREHAPIAISGAGVSLVIAESFARIFFRNAINIGLPIVECPQAVSGCENGHTLQVDLAAGVVKNLTLNESYEAVAFPDFMQEIIQAGGLIGFVKRQTGGEK